MWLFWAFQLVNSSKKVDLTGVGFWELPATKNGPKRWLVLATVLGHFTAQILLPSAEKDEQAATPCLAEKGFLGSPSFDRASAAIPVKKPESPEGVISAPLRSGNS